MTAWLHDRTARWATLLIAVYVVGVSPSLGQPLLESHAYRQTQTAFTAVLFADRGIDLLRPPLPILGPPGILPLEFPLFQALGAVIMRLVINADLAMRLAGLVCFVASAVLLFLLARRVGGGLAALVALAAFLFNAHAWLYGRTSLIEYLATAGGLGFLYFSIRWLDDGSRPAWIAALLAGSIGILVKVTTGVFYLLPIVFWRSPSGRWGFQHPSVWVLIGIVGAAGLAWNGYSDAIRASQPATEFLATQNLYGWFFGSPAQRLDLGSWRVPLVAMLMLTGSAFVVWAVVAARAVADHIQRAFVGTAVLLVLIIPLIFFNLYAIHDYYWAAVAPFIALGIGIGAAWLVRRWPARRARLTIIGLAGAWGATLVGTFGTWSIIYAEPPEQEQTMRIADFISDNSERGDWVVVDGFGWNSAFLYYARRQGFAVPDETTEQDTTDLNVDEILADPVYGPFITCTPAGECTVAASR